MPLLVAAPVALVGVAASLEQDPGLPKLRRLRTSPEPLEPGCEDQVVLSPLSQFFCNQAQPPDIYAIKQLDGHCTLEELVAPMQKMAVLHDRFRRRLMFSAGTWRGEVLQDFDVRRLMREVTLPGPDAQQAFDDYMGHLMTHEPLGHSGLPPWDVLCIHYTCNPGRTDVMMRASHVIGDGQLFMKLIKQIMQPLDAAAEADYAAACQQASPTAAATSRGSSGGSASGSCGGSGSSVASAAGGSCRSSDCDSDDSRESCCSSGNDSSSAAHVGARAAHARRSPLGLQQQQQQQGLQRSGGLQRSKWRRILQRINIFAMLWRFITMCWSGYTALLFTAALPFWFSDPVTAVKASPLECAGERKWACATISLAEFHSTSKQLGHSLNALAVACLAGGVRRYLELCGEQPADRVRLCTLVDTRSMPGLLTGTSGNSNNFSFIGVPLFTGACVPLERLSRVGRALSWIRHSLAVPLAIRMPAVIQFIFRHPAWSSWAILRALPQKTTIGFSNMRGPTGRWALAGHPVRRIHNGVQPNAFGCFVSLFSYGDCLTFTHTCYASKTRQPQVLLDCMLLEYEALKQAAAAAAAGSTKLKAA